MDSEVPQSLTIVPGVWIDTKHVIHTVEKLGKTTQVYESKGNNKFIWNQAGELVMVVDIINNNNISHLYKSEELRLIAPAGPIPTEKLDGNIVIDAPNKDPNDLWPESIRIIGAPQTPLERIISASQAGSKQQRLIALKGIEFIDLLLRKNKDYGGAVFKKPRLAPHLDSSEAILVRLSDKLERIENLLTTSSPEVAESIDDTFKDMVGYLILLQVAKEIVDEQ